LVEYQDSYPQPRKEDNLDTLQTQAETKLKLVEVPPVEGQDAPDDHGGLELEHGGGASEPVSEHEAMVCKPPLPVALVHEPSHSGCQRAGPAGTAGLVKSADAAGLVKSAEAAGPVKSAGAATQLKFDGDTGSMDDVANPQTEASRGGWLPATLERGCTEMLAELERLAQADRLEQFYIEQLPETWSDAAMAYLQRRDPDMKMVRTWLERGKRPDWQEVANENIVVKTWWGRFEQLLLSSNDVVYLAWRTSKPQACTRHRVVAVKSMFNSILQKLHDPGRTRHLGQRETIEQTKLSPFYWAGMANSVRLWVQKCQACIARRGPQPVQAHTLEARRLGERSH
jgi:hypothetical protein